MLPPGPHFACYSVPAKRQPPDMQQVGGGGATSPVTGFFFVVPHPHQQRGAGAGVPQPPAAVQVQVRRYDPYQELLVELEEAEVRGGLGFG